jgi:hypothetical protein
VLRLSREDHPADAHADFERQMVTRNGRRYHVEKLPYFDFDEDRLQRAGRPRQIGVFHDRNEAPQVASWSAQA